MYFRNGKLTKRRGPYQDRDDAAEKACNEIGFQHTAEQLMEDLFLIGEIE